MICVIVVCLIILSASVNAFAQNDNFPANEKGTLIVNLNHKGNAIPDGEFTLYCVALLKKDGETYLATKDFKECNINFNNLDDNNLPNYIYEYILINEIKGTVKPVNYKGEVRFEELENGLYLVVQTKGSLGFKAPTPFLVEMPNYNSQTNEWEYNVEAKPKALPDNMTVPTEPTESPLETETPMTKPSGMLPHTGQLNWPIPVMAFVGIILFAIGFTIYNEGKKK